MGGNSTAGGMSGNRDMFLHFVNVLEEACAPYCILAGYDGYPDEIGSDVDFMVPHEWTDRLPGLIALAAARSGGRLIQHLRHETTATYFVIARLNGTSVSYLHPDSSTDYRRHGRRWLEARGVLERRRRHARGFWIPAAADGFAYYLIKKIDKAQELSERQAAQLTRRYAEDPEGCASVLRQLLPQREAQIVEEAARSGIWSEIPSLGQFQSALHSRTPVEPLTRRIGQAAGELHRFFDRLATPTGLHVVFLGPDGSGKSSIISAVCNEMSKAFRRVQYQHLRPGLLVPKSRGGAVVVDPHGKPPRGAVASTLKLLHFWLDYALGAALWLFPRKVRSTLVVFDRYYHDLLADPLRYRYGGSLKLARLLGRSVPQPDLVFLLDAPAAVLQQRKKEISLREGERQRGAYLALRSEFERARVIDVTQPLDRVVAEVLGQIIDCQEARTATRLRVPRSVPPPAIADPAS